jgi:hypothetical protein
VECTVQVVDLGRGQVRVLLRQVGLQRADGRQVDRDTDQATAAPAYMMVTALLTDGGAAGRVDSGSCEVG